jgi:acyl-CoA thioester hydrolase
MSETLAQTPVFTATVRPEWVDYNGHMSEAYYVLIFGEATDAFYDHVGLDHAARQRDRVSIYTVEAHIRYLVEAHEADTLHIATRILGHDSKRVRLHHAMWRPADATLLAVTELMLLHVDKVSLRASPFGAAAMARIAAVAESGAGLAAPEPAMSRHWRGA